MATFKNDYERRDINAYKVIGFSVLGIAILVILLILLNDYFLIEKNEMVYQTNLKPVSSELRDLRSWEKDVLSNFKLLNADQGIYQIPIERAMQLMAEEGFQKRLQRLKKSR